MADGERSQGGRRTRTRRDRGPDRPSGWIIHERGDPLRPVHTAVLAAARRGDRNVSERSVLQPRRQPGDRSWMSPRSPSRTNLDGDSFRGGTRSGRSAARGWRAGCERTSAGRKMSVTEPSSAPSDSATSVSGQRNPFAAKSTLATHHRSREGGSPIGPFREARVHQVDHARLDGEPRQRMDDLDRDERDVTSGAAVIRIRGDLLLRARTDSKLAGDPTGPVPDRIPVAEVALGRLHGLHDHPFRESE